MRRFGSRFKAKQRRIRGGGRVSNYVPVTDGIELWLDASDTSATNIVESSGLVSQWSDKSGNGYNATQGTGSAQPTTGVQTSNGKNVLLFDGGDTLILPSALYSLPNGNNTVFIVSRRDVEDATTNTVLGLSEGGDGNQRLIFVYTAAAGNSYWQNRTVFTSGVFGAATNTDFNLFSMYRDGTTQSISVNGGAALTNANALSEDGVDAATIGSRAGASSYLTGSISEVIIYTRALSATEITQVNNYLTNKWLNFSVPSDLEGLQLWLDADDSSTITEAGGLVSAWNDKSGQGNNATQGTGSKQPTTEATTENGKNVLDFDGGDTLVLPAALDSIPNSAHTMFVVSNRSTEAATTNAIVSISAVAATRTVMFYSSVAGRVSYRNAGSASADNSSNTNTNMQILRGTFDGASTVTSTVDNNTPVSSATAAAAADADTGTIGSRADTDLYLTGSISEILIYDRVLTSAEITNVETYLSNKWGITI